MMERGRVFVKSTYFIIFRIAMEFEDEKSRLEKEAMLIGLPIRIQCKTAHEYRMVHRIMWWLSLGGGL